METLSNKIKTLASSFFEEMVSIRRYLHAHPELSEREARTAEFICRKLDEYGISYRPKIGGNGIVGTIEGKNPGKRTVALRADMDALPIHEENAVEYKSLEPGVMHACGHDVHMTCLLGAARILKTLEKEWEGTVRLIFQPSEEKFPGGALAMIRDGVLDNPRPDYILALHTLPTMDAGKTGLKAGMYMASTDEIYLTVKGKGGHAATPELNVDTVLIASQIIVSLQQIVSRKAPPGIPTVLSFGRFVANGRTNIIPDEVKMDGTLRTFDEKWRSKAHEEITRLAKGIAHSMGGECEVFIDKGYPFLINDPAITAKAKTHLETFLGKENVEDLEMRMTAEDFAYYSHIIPACFFRIGVKNPEWKEIRNLHTSCFDVDERSIETGMGSMAWLAVSGLADRVNREKL